MRERFKPLELKKIKTHPLKDRLSKVKIKDFAQSFPKGGSLSSFLEALPQILAGKDFKEIVSRIVEAYQKKRVIVFALGAHVIKVGLNPIIIDLMKKGVITGLALNGAGIIHDLEIALWGKTSEEVSQELDKGSFGMAEETAQIINEGIKEGVAQGLGIGQALGRKLLQLNPPYSSLSLLVQGEVLDIPITVHVALGTDIIHFHPSCHPASIGEGTHRDFRLFASLISQLEGGVYLNIGSAVILPEVFLKALTLARNLGYKLKNFTTVNMDFISHYRPLTNVVKRPTQKGGKGYNLIGHHEIMLPLLAAAIGEKL